MEIGAASAHRQNHFHDSFENEICENLCQSVDKLKIYIYKVCTEQLRIFYLLLDIIRKRFVWLARPGQIHVTGKLQCIQPDAVNQHAHARQGDIQRMTYRKYQKRYGYQPWIASGQAHCHAVEAVGNVCAGKTDCEKTYV